MPSLAEKRDQLHELLRSMGTCAVAFSGGVDSGVVAAAAYRALGDQCVAITARSDSLAEGELEQAQNLAKKIGIRHEVIETEEFSHSHYIRNASDRCFHCKTELYQRMSVCLDRLGVTNVLNGANADDVGDHRPGMMAAANHAVRSPLLECGITKQEVRQLAQAWDLSVWDKPAAPCLSSRVAYGVEVTPERLRMIDRGEQFLRGMGLSDVSRSHAPWRCGSPGATGRVDRGILPG